MNIETVNALANVWKMINNVNRKGNHHQYINLNNSNEGE